MSCTPISAFPGSWPPGSVVAAAGEARRIAGLQRKIGQLTIENDFSQKPLDPPAQTQKIAVRGFAINHKRVLPMMHEDNLLCVRRGRPPPIRDYDGLAPHLPIHPNLAAQLTPTAINRLWVADITYIRLPTEFIYLSFWMHFPDVVSVGRSGVRWRRS